MTEDIIPEFNAKYSNMPVGSFKTMRLEKYNKLDGCKEGYTAVANLLGGKMGMPLLLLAGECGLGKTHLTIGAGWWWLLNVKERCLYYKVENLMDKLRLGFSLEERLGNADADTYNRIMKHLDAVPLLLLDDLGAHNDTAWSRAKLAQIIDNRYEKKRHTIITANKIDGLPERVIDRCSEGAIVVMKGKSYRPKMRTT